ncbi:hypothetical protein DFJ73DRAFT_760638 [Zopfochytrium polystomum]|nr:hypothetical protein DFJ73DRAFT_760638 [Zopfochytrium polystomum]
MLEGGRSLGILTAPGGDEEEGNAPNVVLVQSEARPSWPDLLTKFYLIPEGPFLQAWDRWMVVMTIINCILLCLMPAFKVLDVSCFVVSYFIDVMYLIDLFFRFHVAYLLNGFWVIFPKEMAMHYSKSMQLRFDLLCNIPIDIVGLGWIGKGDGLYILVLVRIIKLVRAARIISFFRNQERKLHASFSIQIMKFASFLIILNHGIACIFFTIACPSADIDSCKQPSWIYQSNLRLIQSEDDGSKTFSIGTASIYVTSLYYTVTTMTTTGYGDIRPQNDSEKIFAVFVMSCGVFFYGYISGKSGAYKYKQNTPLLSLSSLPTPLQEQLPRLCRTWTADMDAVRQYMADRAMDSDMQERVIDYYDYLWERNKGIDVKNLFEDMPSTFRGEVALSLNSGIIDKANIFNGCSIGFRRMIAISMKLYLFTANEYVVYKGDVGEEMYFVTQGRIDIYATEDKRRPTASLIEGAHFGEFQIILGNRHEYSAKAVCNTDIYVLHKEELDAAFAAYPEDQAMVYAATEERYKQAQKAKKSRQTARVTEIEDEPSGGLAGKFLHPTSSDSIRGSRTSVSANAAAAAASTSTSSAAGSGGGVAASIASAPLSPRESRRGSHAATTSSQHMSFAAATAAAAAAATASAAAATGTRSPPLATSVSYAAAPGQGGIIPSSAALGRSFSGRVSSFASISSKRGSVAKYRAEVPVESDDGLTSAEELGIDGAVRVVEFGPQQQAGVAGTANLRHRKEADGGGGGGGGGRPLSFMQHKRSSVSGPSSSMSPSPRKKGNVRQTIHTTQSLGGREDLDDPPEVSAPLGSLNAPHKPSSLSKNNVVEEAAEEEESKNEKQS